MALGPRTKLLAIIGLFTLPIVASLVTYHFFPPEPTGNYGELLRPAPVTAQPFVAEDGAEFRFSALAGKWILVVSDSGDCPQACADKLATLRQVRLALGRNADRLARVFVVDDTRAPDPKALEPFPGTRVVRTPLGMALPAGAVNDRAHIYVIDPRGHVMLRFPARPEMRRMLKDLERLLKASQIG